MFGFSFRNNKEGNSDEDSEHDIEPENSTMAEQQLQEQIAALTAQLAAAQAANNDNSAPNTAEVCRVNAKPPPFSRDNPDLFFIQSESQFTTAGITQDATKYHYVVGNLDPKILNFVSDFLREPPATGKYEQLKARILREFTDSDMKKIRRVINECELGDDKPSQLLKKMKDLAGTKLNDDAIKSLWLDRLPEGVRAVVSIGEGDSTQWAKQADIMMENMSFSNVSAVSKPTQSQKSSQSEIAELRKEIAEFRQMFSERGRSETRQYNNKRDRSRAKSKNNDKVCFYHSRFGAKAKKCTKPCEFKADSEN